MSINQNCKIKKIGRNSLIINLGENFKILFNSEIVLESLLLFSKDKVEVEGIPFFNCSPHIAIPKYPDLSDIDIVLISHTLGLLGIPYLETNKNLNAPILCSRPAFRYSQLMLKELSIGVKEGDFLEMEKTTDPQLKSTYDNHDWIPLSFDELKEPILLNIGQPFEVNEKKFTFYPSGYEPGSVNWLIEIEPVRIAILGPSRARDTPEMRIWAPIKIPASMIDVDLVIVTNVSNQNHPGASKIRDTVHSTLRSGGSVLLLSYPTAKIYELLLTLNSDSRRVHLIGETSKELLQNVAGLVPWLSELSLQNISKGEPFPFSNRYISGSSKLQDIREPCVIICTDGSGRLGLAPSIIETWSNNSKSALILTECEHSIERLAAPYAPISMETVYAPLDPRLDVSEALQILEIMNPKLVAADRDILNVALSLNSSFELPINYMKVYIADRSARSLFMKRVGDVLMTQISASAEIHEGSVVLSSSNEPKQKRYLIGSLNIKEVAKALIMRNIDAVIQDNTIMMGPLFNNCEIEVDQENNSIKISCLNEFQRTLLRDTILSQTSQIREVFYHFY